MSLPGYDAWATGGRYSVFPVHVTCLKCEHEWDDNQEEEYGAAWLSKHEQCPKCGADGDDLAVDMLDAIDIQKRRLESHGEDF